MSSAPAPVGRTVRLDSICRIVQGGRHKLSGKHFSEDGGYPAYGAGGHNGNLPSYEFDEPAIVLSAIGARCGKCFQPNGRWSSLANTSVFFPDAKLADVRFLWYQLNDESSWHRSGTAQPYIKPSDVKARKVYLPLLAEQKRIAGILDAADALRAKRRAALAQLDALLQSTFLDMFGDPVTNPMEWVERPFGDIATDTKLGLVRSSKEFGWDFRIPYVRMNAVTGNGCFLPEKVQSTHADEEEARAFALRPGDFLFNTRNSKELVGKVCVFPGPEGWLFNNNLMRVRFSANVEPWVIAMQFRFRRVQRELEKRKSGTTSVFAVYWKSLRTLPVLVPPSELQRRFAAIVESIEHQKARQRAHLAELDTFFASLQSRAFRGEL